MKPIDFKGRNIILGESQEEYQSLPACLEDSPEGSMASCWKLDWKERLKVLFTGKVWFSQMTFNKPPMPIYLTTEQKEVIVFNEPNGDILKPDL